MARVRADKKRQQAAAKRSAAKAAAVASRQQALVSQAQALAAKNAVYTALLPYGVVVHNRTLFTKSNWDVVANDTCPICGWLPKGCFCS
jgi:hypothetical protein